MRDAEYKVAKEEAAAVADQCLAEEVEQLRQRKVTDDGEQQEEAGRDDEVTSDLELDGAAA